MITKVINVNLHQPIYERLTAKQGDIASRYLLFHLLDGDKPFDLSNRTVRVYAIKPDKTEIFNDLTINDASKGYCTLELTSQCLASAGVVKMELYISESGKVLTSIPFELEVIACINTANGVASTNEFSALEAALGSLQDYNNLRREIVQARKGYGTVGRRLDNFDSQLEQIDNNINDVKTEVIYSSYLVKALVTITDDDCHPLFLTRVKPVLEANNVKCSLCVPTSQVGLSGTMTLEQLLSLQEEGYEILSHGHNGILMNMSSTSEMENDLKMARQYFKENGLDDKDILIYNGGNYNTDIGREVKRVARKYYKYAFNNFGTNAPYVDNFMIGRTDFNAKDLATLKTEVDNAIKYRAYLVLMVHSWQETFDANKLEQLIKYIQSKSIDIVPASEGVKLKANYIDYGDRDIYGGTKIDANGKMTSNFLTLDASTANRQIYDFPYGKSTFYVNSYVYGFTPIPSGLKDYSWSGYPCIVDVIRTGLDSCEQVLTLRYTKRIRYTRNWSTSSNNWTEWSSEFSHINIDSMANTDILKNISNYDKNVVTEFRVAGGSNTPNSKAGVIQVHRMGDDTYSYMEFTPYDEATKYKASWNAGTSTWNSWIKYA